MAESIRKFVQEHPDDDLSELLLHASRYRDVDMKMAVMQIQARHRIKDKLPAWRRDDRLFFPSTLSVEQCSSEITALYKQRLVGKDDWVCDLTGGLGVDSFFFAQKVRRVTYVEYKESYCDAARYNFPLLSVSPIDIVHGDSISLIANNDRRITGANVFYIDPARRGTGNKRLYAISDCEPDLMKIISLLPKPYRMIVKLSPMLDITQVLKQIPHVREAHVVSVKNECKELLIVTDCKQPDTDAMRPLNAHPTIHCINYTMAGAEQSFLFRLPDESGAQVQFAKQTGRYLYEPNVSVLKAGAYKSIALPYGIEKLHVSSHLYTSHRLISSFPGRIFEITGIIPFNNRICKTLHVTIPKANMAVRNFSLSVDELRKRTRISDGGDIYLFATTLSDDQKVLIKCAVIQR